MPTQNPTTSASVLVIVGRANFQKNSDSIASITDTIRSHGYKCLWFQSDYEKTLSSLDDKYKKLSVAKYIQLLDQRKTLHLALRRIVKMGLLLTVENPPSFISQYFRRGKWTNEHAAMQTTHELRSFIRACNFSRVDLLAHSAGGIAATKVHDEPNVHKLVCFGYPFKHPEAPAEEYRTKHLEHICKQVLIIQGTEDEYGKPDDLYNYRLSPQTEIYSIETDHNYDKLTEVEIKTLSNKILTFLRC